MKKIEKMNTMRNNDKLWKIEKTNENNEKMMKNKEKNNEKWWKIGKKWTQWENDEKRRNSNEKLWKTGNKWKQLENDENTIFFFSALLVGDCRCTLRWHMTSENDENYRVSFIYSFPFVFLSFS